MGQRPHKMVTVTARGQFLKALVDEQTGRISVRKLATELARRPGFPNDAEDVRRALQRYITDGVDDRDVSKKYVDAISDVLGIEASEWPPATIRPTLSSLRDRLEAVEGDVQDLVELADDLDSRLKALEAAPSRKPAKSTRQGGGRR
jgi:hypothetical protein